MTVHIIKDFLKGTVLWQQSKQTCADGLIAVQSALQETGAAADSVNVHSGSVPAWSLNASMSALETRDNKG